MMFISFFVLISYVALAFRRLLRYLHIFQQEEYSPSHYLRWIVQTLSIDKRISLLLAFLFVVRLVSRPWIPLWVWPLFMAIIFAVAALKETDPRKVAKKKLVMTRRAVRILGVAFIISSVMGLLGSYSGNILLWIIVTQLLPFTLVVANILLIPLEAFIQQKIMKEASERLAVLNPHVIGITGSFGKTSVKHILGHILEMDAPTLFTPGSVNTLMGVSRIIREKLKPGLRYFLVEMGAYGPGSIDKLCRLTPPHIGIITALGEAHYERFKTLDTVAHAKFELAQAVLLQKGKIVIHEDVLNQGYARSFVEAHRADFIICGSSIGVDLTIVEAIQSARGLMVSVEWQGKKYDLFSPLYGMQHTGNIALAFATALILGVQTERAVAALRTVPQIKHRLEVKTQADGTIYIDDGFNSNPRGFAAALDLLTLLSSEKGSRRILITPGIVELGTKHDEVHKALGVKTADNADIVIAIQATRIPTFIEGFQAYAGQKPLIHVANLAEAQKWLAQHGRAGDIILIENDLPDTGEAKLIL